MTCRRIIACPSFGRFLVPGAFAVLLLLPVPPAAAQTANSYFEFLNARRLDRLELLKPLICSWITDGARPDFPGELMADLRYFGGVWGSLIIHDVIAGTCRLHLQSFRRAD